MVGIVQLDAVPCFRRVSDAKVADVLMSRTGENLSVARQLEQLDGAARTDVGKSTTQLLEQRPVYHFLGLANVTSDASASRFTRATRRGDDPVE